MDVRTAVKDFWDGIPLVTRYLLSGAALVTLPSNLGLFSPMRVVWVPYMIYRKFEVWRIISSLLYMGPFSQDMTMAINFILLYTFSKKLETGRFKNKIADYVFMLMFGCFLMLIIGTLMRFMYMGDCLVTFIVYVYCRTNPNEVFSLLGITTCKANYMPFILVALKYFFGLFGLPTDDIAGLVIGHLYIYLKDIYPSSTGKHILSTPQILCKYIPNTGENRFGGVQQPHINTRLDWGQGHILGGR